MKITPYLSELYVDKIIEFKKLIDEEIHSFPDYLKTNLFE